MYPFSFFVYILDNVVLVWGWILANSDALRMRLEYWVDLKATIMDDLSSSPGSSDQDDLFVPRGVQPYLYEPLAREDGVQVCETGMEATGDNGSARLGHINW